MEMFYDYQFYMYMKNLLLSFVVSALTMAGLTAQVKYETITMVAGPQPCLTIILPDTDPKFAQSEWKDYMKPYGSVGSVRGSKETVVDNIHISTIGDGSLIKVYNLAEPSLQGTRMIMWIDMGADYLMDTDSNYHIAETFLLNYAHKVKVDLVAIDLEDQQKALGKLESNLEKLQQSHAKLEETIESSKSKINDAEIGLPINDTNQDNARTEIEAQRKYVDQVRDDPKALKTENKNLAKLQNNLDKLQRENENFHKDIESNRDKIAKAEQDIVENLQEQNTVGREIESQRIVVEAVQNKLQSLKEEGDQ